MSNKSQPYFQQEVTHGEAQQWLDDPEDADHALIVDHTDGDHALWGVFEGYEVVQNPAGPDLNVQIANGVAYDEDGQRIPHTTGPTLLDLSTAVPGANSRYVRVYVEFATVASDARVDGDGIPLNYRLTESFAFSFELGAIGAPPAKPAITANKVLLATILIATGAVQIVNADISMALDTDPANPGDIDRQEGGVAIPHGRMAIRPIYFQPPPGAAQIRLDMGGQRLRTYGGDIEMDDIDTPIEAGGHIFMQRGWVHRARYYSAEGPPASASAGFVYVQSGGGFDEYGTLLAVDKWLNYDASHFLPMDNNNQQPWQGFAAVPNVWQIDQVAAGAIGGGAVPSWDAFVNAWRCEINMAGPYPKYSWPLQCALTGLPNGCSLTRVEFDVEVLVDMTVVLNVKYANMAVIRRRGDSIDILTPDPATNFQQAVPGRYAVAEDIAGGYIIDNTNEEYYAVFYLKTADAGVYNGLRVCGARAKFQIREASGVY